MLLRTKKQTDTSEAMEVTRSSSYLLLAIVVAAALLLLLTIKRAPSPVGLSKMGKALKLEGRALSPMLVRGLSLKKAARKEQKLWPPPLRVENGEKTAILGSTAMLTQWSQNPAKEGHVPEFKWGLQRLCSEYLAHAQGAVEQKAPFLHHWRCSVSWGGGKGSGYTLEVHAGPPCHVLIRGDGIEGAAYALATLGQLFEVDGKTGQVCIPHCPWRIEDAPAHEHRGVMLDVSHQYMEPARMRQIINSMAMVRLNVLHLRLHSKKGTLVRAKKLADDDSAYSFAEINSLQCYASRRFIRVILEYNPVHSTKMYDLFNTCSYSDPLIHLGGHPGISAETLELARTRLFGKSDNPPIPSERLPPELPEKYRISESDDVLYHAYLKDRDSLFEHNCAYTKQMRGVVWHHAAHLTTSANSIVQWHGVQVPENETRDAILTPPEWSIPNSAQADTLPHHVDFPPLPRVLGGELCVWEDGHGVIGAVFQAAYPLWRGAATREACTIECPYSTQVETLYGKTHPMDDTIPEAAKEQLLGPTTTPFDMLRQHMPDVLLHLRNR